MSPMPLEYSRLRVGPRRQRPAARSTPTPAQLADARASGFAEEARRIAQQQLSAAPEPRPAPTLSAAAKTADAQELWRDAFARVRRQWGYPSAVPAADAPSSPIAVAAAPSFKHALAAVDADQLWARAIEQARRGGTIRQS